MEGYFLMLGLVSGCLIGAGVTVLLLGSPDERLRRRRARALRRARRG